MKVLIYGGIYLYLGNRLQYRDTLKSIIITTKLTVIFFYDFFSTLQDYNFTVEFYWSPFLIQFDRNHKSGKKVIVLDKLSPNSDGWRGADIMVFNSGHWWAHTGKFKSYVIN